MANYIIYITRRFSKKNTYYTINVCGDEAAYAMYRKAVDKFVGKCYISLCDGNTGEILCGVLD